MRRTLFIIIAAILYTGASTAAAHAQVEVLRGIYRMDKAINAREARQDRARDAADRDAARAEEAHIERQRQQLEQAPGSFPRTRQSHEAALSNNPWARANRKAAGAAPVVELFVAADCPDCGRMERYLNEVGVPYRLQLLSPGSEAEQAYLAQIGRGLLPVVRINGHIVRGYRPEDVRQTILREKPQ